MTIASQSQNPSHGYNESSIGHKVHSELERLRRLEGALDPDTIGLLSDCGVRPDWRCLELGAGAGSIAYWLAGMCPEGSTTAVDLDTRFLDPGMARNLTISEQDVLDCDFAPQSFDLIHTRALLLHLPQRDEIYRRAAQWLAPGGWLVTEEPVIIDDRESPYPEFSKMTRAVRTLWGMHGADLRWSRSLPGLALRNGLTDLSVSTRIMQCGQGGAGDRHWTFMINQMRDPLIATGLLSPGEWQAGIDSFDDPAFIDISLVMISVRARRPV
ncbi:methyltransferase domain-containing protein [Kitasatospora sp. NPDC004723]|uniref:methyltransferase domain-containing protein n=1 Tax=Kitasatospora sp. NPDC004723 TaxID=3154288 RepID=UPI0033BCA7E2